MAEAETVQPARPVCECGCEPPVELPPEAWNVAGPAGVGRAHGGGDLMAIAVGHIDRLKDTGFVVYREHVGWVEAGPDPEALP